MTDTRDPQRKPSRNDPERKLLRDLGRAKHARDEALAALAREEALSARLRVELVAMHVQRRLLHLDYFDTFIGIDTVTAPDGSVDVRELHNRLTDLLVHRPELAASAANVGPTR